MTSQAECRSHAALCRQLARQEPTNRCVWRAEAEYWLRLSKGRPRGEAGKRTRFQRLGEFADEIGRLLINPGVARN